MGRCSPEDRRQQHEGSCARIDNPFFPKDRMETDMNVIDFRFRPNTPEINQRHQEQHHVQGRL